MVLAENYTQEIEAILAKYPSDQKRSAVMPLLFLAQREYGTLTNEAITEVGELIGLQITEVASLVGFYSLYHDRPGGKYRIQVCTDLPCALKGAQTFADELCEKLDIEMGGTTSDGQVTVEQVKCLAACDRAPLFQLQEPNGFHYHEDQSIGSAMALIESLRVRGQVD
ncbi:MAG: NAD(P)H-dependent oxidoreductase subunit E [Chloroflexi bacterium]|nr:NAD(P)H-dependent oxidoreductase subunit E [Chloroflexota bacterium]